MNEIAPVSGRAVTHVGEADEETFVTVYLDRQLFGISIERVQDILMPENIARIPLAPPEVAGAINLRGRIVTVLNARTRLGLKPRNAAAEEDHPTMCVTVEQGNELYSLMVDRVGEVRSVNRADLEPNPPTLDPKWRSIASGVVQIQNELLVILDIDALLGFGE